ncbi:hypothetical protein MOQ_004640 [Trypanosoma cruzi marinkellei]|uniref:Uncharacterized protein n=1 Tax=Trypanosoma cruzi marinkellei TaxID=85056 RepID=K2M8Z7_TRYCR|nr:hypothetical protein MOQ_004640 [Trypanosoma cruzi marinkellei]
MHTARYGPAPVWHRRHRTHLRKGRACISPLTQTQKHTKKWKENSVQQQPHAGTQITHTTTAMHHGKFPHRENRCIYAYILWKISAIRTAQQTAVTLPFLLHPPFTSQRVAPQIATLYGQNKCLVVVSLHSNTPGGTRGTSGVRPPEGRNSTAMSPTTQTLRVQCPVSCADSARSFWTRRGATQIAPSEHNSRRVPFRPHSWQWWHPLPRCVLLASITMLQNVRKKGCPAGAGARLGGQCPSRRDTQRDS